MYNNRKGGTIMVSKQKILLILLIFVIISLSLENTVSAINLTSFLRKIQQVCLQEIQQVGLQRIQ